ncbi:riboflavin synthase [Secundilactobacillus folii]|uniref:Riboflavin synthase n=1 Tax=Secundilactobacillus folii TaxID=2678357 RepID=A0A7X2XW93_9LACO|nr:riboflavin synthase [Secundilactobacillus folii]MTV82779.1 riboflavin synthase [Secundilactobacillus folii]
MFTGIIKGIGRVIQIKQHDESAHLTVEAPLFTEIQPQLGDSIAFNGICLTATSVTGSQIGVDVMPETSRRTALQGLRVNDRLNLEPALPATARLDGHFVLGHVDTTAKLIRQVQDQDSRTLTFEIDPEYDDYIVEKGSVAIDGVSLTVTQKGAQQFSVSLIPYTLAETTLGDRQIGDLVNIETDVIGKYIVAMQRKEAVQ